MAGRLQQRTSSVAYFVYDPSAHSGRFLFDDRPELDQYELAAMEPFSFPRGTA